MSLDQDEVHADARTQAHDCQWRTRCYGCHRPLNRCFCDRIPTIHNQTEVLILQHRRERFHAFNTARILQKALVNSKLLVDHSDRLAAAFSQLTLSPDVGFLYPGADSQLLTDLPVEKRPKQLVVIDGTWHHTKTLVRDIPRLQLLPRYRIAPVEPSRYRIRREPDAQFLSTLEATVAALRCLEPGTDGFEQLLTAFDAMIDGQLEVPKNAHGWRKNSRRTPNPLKLPKVLTSRLEDIVVVYGETSPGFKGDCRGKRTATTAETNFSAPVYWVAERLVSGERFENAIKPPVSLSATFLQHLQLDESTFDQARAMGDVRHAWESFLRPRDTIAYFYSHTPRLMADIGGLDRPLLHLKSVRIEERRNKTLEKLLDSLEIVPGPAMCLGRAGTRLANTVAFANYLHKKRNETLSTPPRRNDEFG